MKQHQLLFQQFLVLLLLMFIQVTIVPLFAIGLYTPDILLLWILFIAFRFGQIEATVAGFCAGLLQDIFASHLLGLSALTKTLSGFLAGYLYNENIM